MRWRRYATTGVAVAAVGLSVAGCEIRVGDSTETRSYDVAGTFRTLVVTDQAGRIDVTTGSGPVRVTETLVYDEGRPVTSHTTEGDTLRLRGNGCPGRPSRCEIRYDIRVPASTAVDLTLTAGPVRLSGLSGDIKVNSTAGLVEGDQLTSATATVRTTAGRIALTFATPPSTVDTENTSGMTRIRLPGGVSYAVDARTTGGLTRVEVPVDAAATHRVTARATAGMIDVGTA
jgi:hypothetical protein